MSTVAASESSNIASPGLKSKKNKKKKTGGKTKVIGDPKKTNGSKINDEEIEEIEANEDESRTPLDSEKLLEDAEAPVQSSSASGSISGVNGVSTDPVHLVSPNDITENSMSKVITENESVTTAELGQSSSPSKSPRTSASTLSNVDTEAGLDALARERTVLIDEVSQLRRSLEEIQERHEEDLANLREQLEESRGEKEHVETQYRNLLGKVNTIRSQLGERLKADAEDLSQARSRIEDLEEQCGTLREQNNARAAELTTMVEQNDQQSKELSSLRNRTTLSQQNWLKEREDLAQREALAKEEFEAAKQAMQDWEILAMEERSIRESIAEKVTDLEEQLSAQREGYEKAAAERDSQSLTVDGLQRALQEIQDARRRELRELVENSQKQVENLQKQLQSAETGASEATSLLESTKKELERALPFEKEVKEKNLLIGKLRHEAVTLNEHLTKALRYLRKGKPEDNIDKQLITNHFLQFLALERSDPKKFQILQIIAALLAWTDEQREQAGLARPGASNPNLRVPVSPWHRTPSTPALSTDFFPEGGSRKESLAELWSDFLVQEAQDGVKSPSSPSASISSKPTT